MLLYSNTNMKAQSILYNYMILINWEKERASMQFNFLKLNPPSQPILASPPYQLLSLNEKNSIPPQKIFANLKVATPHISGVRTPSTHRATDVLFYIIQSNMTIPPGKYWYTVGKCLDYKKNTWRSKIDL